MDNKNSAEDENAWKETIKLKETKNKTNKKLKRKNQEKVLKVRKLLQERLASKLAFFQSIDAAEHEKTPRRHGNAVKKSEALVYDSTGHNAAEQQTTSKKK